MWIDTHCHWDAPEFAPDREPVRRRALAAGVSRFIVPVVQACDFAATQALCRAAGQPYALGIHPLYTPQAQDQDLTLLDRMLGEAADDPLLVAVGEIGLDFFVAGLDPQRQQHFYVEQLKLARRHGLPVILHVRRSADALLAGLRRVSVAGGIAHAFNGSPQQAQAFIELGFALGFGGALTFERALNLRRLARELPETALVLETDAPDIPPQWLYKTAEQRAAGERSRNEPAELPQIAQTLAGLRGWTLEHTAAVTTANACRVLPRLNPC
ncbi:TatD DNase family protein [Inhella inkyongensis]|uniref:TatD DNase family protein n=1 Tax=Inhella inkyongensis TaxID=392593 RepID=A0A840S1Q6_9BURK|nr:TatD family hydrolase [Inhella inkyongensis]MBB5204225.1 TatD DNase family protein [Inhella inkyongensis]